jgi:arsenite-transporting ATPase
MMALLEILAWVKAETYAEIVVDTAPAGHTLRLLDLPQLMRRWLAALDKMLAKYRYMVKLYRGAYRKDSVDLYLDEATAELVSLGALLRSPERCRFVPVMLAEDLSIHVTQRMLAELDRLELPVQEIVVNRLRPSQPDCPDCLDWRRRQSHSIDALTPMFSRHRLWGLPLLLEEVRGIDALTQLWGQARPLSDAVWRDPHGAASSQQPCQPARPPAVSHPMPLPGEATKLLLFAGKGGVGKTSLACASALRLAQQRPEQKILLFSIDPAHSLAACLGCSVGPEETCVGAGLFAIELDAKAEFERLKHDYAGELTGIFKRPSGSSGVELAFDREVMERMLDVAPLGLDEILALTRIVDLMERGRYDLFVLDTAPTGHLLRFLEMPELIDQWLKTFFGLFLKYRQVFWLPKITQTMVGLSKQLKMFRRLLVDAQRAQLIAVTIPTALAFAETEDLLAACARLRIAVPALMVNLLTAPRDCPTCSSIHRLEQSWLDRYRTLAAGRPLVQIFRQNEVAGFVPLSELGLALYEA